MATLGQVQDFQHTLANLADRAVDAVRRVWDGAAESYPALVDPFLAAAAQLSAHWYHSLAPDVPFASAPAPLPVPGKLEANARWTLTPNDDAGGLSVDDGRLEATTHRNVFNASRDTIKYNADREHVRYARYASANACPFCRILATKTQLYESAESATRVIGRGGRARGTRKVGDTYHDNCHCIAVPVRPGETYTPPEYVDGWLKEYNAARKALGPGASMDDICAYMRAHPGESAAAPAEPAEPPEPEYRRIAREFEAEHPMVGAYFHEGDDPGVLRDFTGGVDHVLDKYPQIERRARYGPQPAFASVNSSNVMDMDTYAQTAHKTWTDENGVNHPMTNRVDFNRRWTQDPLLLQGEYQREIESGFHPPLGGHPPAWGIGVHEMGHVMDDYTGYRARNRVEGTLTDYFNEHYGEPPASYNMGQLSKWYNQRDEDFMKWCRVNMPRYSFADNWNDTPQQISAGEALAEAFADVEANGDKATITSKLLHNMLVQEFQKPGGE